MQQNFAQSIISPILSGRANAITQLQESLIQAQIGNGHIVLITGEAGIGKSRLIAEVKSHAGRLHFGILEGQCYQTDLVLPYAPLLNLRQPLNTLEPLPVQLAEKLSEVLAVLTQLLARRLGDDHEPEAIKRQIFAMLNGFLLDYGVEIKHKTQPQHQYLLIVIEDVHWCDDISLEFLTQFARQITTKPILLILSFRQDETQGALAYTLAALERGRLAYEISLERLNIEQTSEVIRAIFKQDLIRRDFLETIHTLTDGNPFFIEETLKSLVSYGDIYLDRGIWTRKTLAKMQIPRTVQAAVQQRRQKLSASANEVLDWAAVIGRRFRFELLQQLTRHQDQDLLALIKLLIAEQLVVEVALQNGGEYFEFRHALAREAIYNSLLAHERKLLHRRIFEALQQAPENQAALSLAELAHHAYAAQLWQSAWELTQQAGKQAQQFDAPRAAIEQFGRAITALTKLNWHTDIAYQPNLMQLYGAQAQSHELLGEFEQARTGYEQALALAERINDRHAEWDYRFRLGFLWTGRDMNVAGNYLSLALTTARGLNNPILLGNSLNRIGNWHLNMEQPNIAQQLHTEALAIFNTQSDALGLALSHDLLGITQIVRGNYPASLIHHDTAAALFRQHKHLTHLASCLATASFRGGCYQGDVAAFADIPVESCWQLGSEALRIAQQINWRFGEANANAFLALAMGVRGQYTRALNCARNSVDISLEIEAPIWEGVAHVAFGKTYHDCFAFALAETHLERALNLALKLGASEFLNTVRAFLASTFIAQGKLTQASELLSIPNITLENAQTTSRRLFLAIRAELLLTQGHAKDAFTLFSALSEFAHQPASTRGSPRLWHWQALSLLTLNRFNEAESLWLIAINAATQQQLLPILWQMYLHLSRLYYLQNKIMLSTNAYKQAQQVVQKLSDELPTEALRLGLHNGLESLKPTATQLTRLQAQKYAYDGLTTREREVAGHLANGSTNKVIAEQLVVSERTVEKHIENAMGKLGFTSRTQLAVWATQRKLG